MRTSVFAWTLVIGALAGVPISHAQTVTWNSISLRWTAPGDDSLVGTAAEFDLRYSTSAIISISTEMLNGSSAMPTAERACLPIASPKISTIKSEQPLMTLGWSVNPGAELTIPSTFTILFTLSRLPSVARVAANRLRQVERAA